MIKASELRIGSFVFYEGVLKKISLIDFENFLHYPSDDRKYTPIPLTEEWLLKLGFKKVVYKSTHPDFTDETCYELEYKEFFISYADDFSMTLFVSKKTQDDELGICPDFKNMRYVHQLQNLYCALTGEELTINEI